MEKSPTNSIKMAIKTKEQYERSRENAARRMLDNKRIEILTDEQHEALAELCSVRHEMHNNMLSIAKCGGDYLRNIILANIGLQEAGIATMNFVPTDESDFIDIDNIDLLCELGEEPDDSDERDEWVDNECSRIINELEELNSKIEKYLAGIDTKYGTNYCPTGDTRIF